MDQAQLEAVVAQAYTAFVDAQGGRDTSGRPYASYAALHDQEKGAWRQAVMAALSAPAPATAAPAPFVPAPKDNTEDDDESPQTGRRRAR